MMGHRLSPMSVITVVLLFIHLLIHSRFNTNRQTAVNQKHKLKDNEKKQFANVSKNYTALVLED